MAASGVLFMKQWLNDTDRVKTKDSNKSTPSITSPTLTWERTRAAAVRSRSSPLELWPGCMCSLCGLTEMDFTAKI